MTPFMAFFFHKYSWLAGSAIRVILGKFTWISYCNKANLDPLPVLKPGIFELCSSEPELLNKDILEKMNLEYARDYKISNDFSLLWKNLYSLKK
jgi:hypothetical protein